MNLYYDCEFLECGPNYPIDLLSLGMVRDDGKELYLQNLNCHLSRANQWVVDNVLPHLEGVSGEWIPGLPVEQQKVMIDVSNPVWQYRPGIAEAVVQFTEGEDVTLWGYYSAYDHVALCQLFGTMMDLPKNFPMMTRDLKQWCDDLGDPKLPEQGKNEHHALLNARWNKQIYDFLGNKDRG